MLKCQDTKNWSKEARNHSWMSFLPPLILKLLHSLHHTPTDLLKAILGWNSRKRETADAVKKVSNSKDQRLTPS